MAPVLYSNLTTAGNTSLILKKNCSKELSFNATKKCYFKNVAVTSYIYQILSRTVESNVTTWQFLYTNLGVFAFFCKQNKKIRLCCFDSGMYGINITNKINITISKIDNDWIEFRHVSITLSRSAYFEEVANSWAKEEKASTSILAHLF